MTATATATAEVHYAFHGRRHPITGQQTTQPVVVQSPALAGPHNGRTRNRVWEAARATAVRHALANLPRGQWVVVNLTDAFTDAPSTPDWTILPTIRVTLDEGASAALRAAVEAGAVEQVEVHRGAYAGSRRVDEPAWRWKPAG